MPRYIYITNPFFIIPHKKSLLGPAWPEECPDIFTSDTLFYGACTCLPFLLRVDVTPNSDQSKKYDFYYDWRI
jgi:hypothetical protein